MTTLRARLHERVVRDRPAPPAGEHVTVWDETDKGFCLVVRAGREEADRAFTVPLSLLALENLKRQQRDNPVFGEDGGWVFPTHGMDGRVTYVMELKERSLPSPHRLRDTFISFTHEAGVPLFTVKAPVNNALPGGDVTYGYTRPGVEHLRAAAQRVVDLLAERMTRLADAS